MSQCQNARPQCHPLAVTRRSSSAARKHDSQALHWLAVTVLSAESPHYIIFGVGCTWSITTVGVEVNREGSRRLQAAEVRGIQVTVMAHQPTEVLLCICPPFKVLNGTAHV